MTGKLVTVFTIFLFLALMMLALVALSAYYADLPNNLSQYETIVLG